MSILLKNHSLVAKSAAKVVPKGCERRLRATLISNKVEEDVVGFGDGEFLTDLSLTLVNSLKTLASVHVYRLCRKICLQQMVCEKTVRSKDVKIFGVKKL